MPGARVSAPVLTEKDLDDLTFGLAQGVDYVAISFVRSAADVRRVTDLIARAGRDTPVIAKIEKPEALDDLDAILHAVGGVMVARGDLGVEMSPAQVPLAQKRIIEEANCMGVPVITATQMLDSMTHNPRPTRAEANDVANAIFDGTDAVMLSGETAMGDFPVEAVQMMAEIAEVADASERLVTRRVSSRRWPETTSVAGAIGAASYAIVDALPIRAVVAFTRSGNTARLIAHLRPNVPILALTPHPHVERQLALVWGVTPLLADFGGEFEAFEHYVEQATRTHGVAQPGEYVVMTGGHPIIRQEPTNFLKILQVGG
jgi:pyruvate kinase